MCRVSLHGEVFVTFEFGFQFVMQRFDDELRCVIVNSQMNSNSEFANELYQMPWSSPVMSESNIREFSRQVQVVLFEEPG